MPDPAASALLDVIRGAPVSWQDVDVQRFLELSGIHAVTPTIARAVERLDAPPEVADELDRRRSLIANQNLLRTSELLHVLGALAEEGVRAVPFKGPVLALVVYGDLAMRRFVDLDVVVEPRSVERSAGVLGRLGYVGDPVIPPALLDHRIRTGHELVFAGPAEQAPVELQWAALPRFFSLPFPMEEAIERSGELELGGVSVRSFAVEDLYLLLCIHGAKHRWERLAWILDLDALVRSAPAMDWETVRRRAARIHALRIARIGPAIAWRALGSDWVPAVQAALGLDAAADRLAAEAFGGLFRRGEAAEHPPEVAFDPYHLKMREHAADRVRHAWRLALTPTDEELARANGGFARSLILPRRLAQKAVSYAARALGPHRP
jgi:Uncharacterised nucleotidyltransferase